METKTGLKLGKEDTKSLRGDSIIHSDADAPGILLLSEFTSCCRVISGALKVSSGRSTTFVARNLQIV